jgi:hypothetical protein
MAIDALPVRLPPGWAFAQPSERCDFHWRRPAVYAHWGRPLCASCASAWGHDPEPQLPDAA